MKIYKEVSEIANKLSEINSLVDKLEEYRLDIHGVDWTTAKFFTPDEDDIKYFEDTNGVTEDYYVTQNIGYCEDYCYGHLYFKTDIPNQYVKVYFEV